MVKAVVNLFNQSFGVCVHFDWKFAVFSECPSELNLLWRKFIGVEEKIFSRQKWSALKVYPIR